MAKKTLLILGGSRLIVPIIRAAHELGCYVVTCDYLPDNSGHQFADEYRNVSIVDKEAVLAVAKDVGAHGITSFAADPGVVSAAYVAEKLGLPFQGSYDAVRTLQDKARFRELLRRNGFNAPEAYSFTSVEEAEDRANVFPYPVIVKPVDAAGSKGVSRVDSSAGISEAVRYALKFSLTGSCIIERFIEKSGPQCVIEGFTVNGRFESMAFMDHLFDTEGPNPYAPTGHTVPATLPGEFQAELSQELQRLAALLGLRTGIYNIEARVGTDGMAYIMEVSPRGGGNRLAELVSTASNVNLVEATVRAALGEDPGPLGMPEYDGYWLQQMLFSRRAGTYQGIEFPYDGFERRHVRDLSVWIEPGARVEAFTSAMYAFGSAFMRFETRDELGEYLADFDKRMQAAVQ